jgi:hypothetical protein
MAPFSGGSRPVFERQRASWCGSVKLKSARRVIVLNQAEVEILARTGFRENIRSKPPPALSREPEFLV